jgi:hypothetical protein
LLDRRNEDGGQWPEPWLSLNPNFESGGSVDELVESGLLHPEAAKIFRTKANRSDTGLDKPIVFHRHQREAIEAATTGESYVLTTGTGSGKSLAYIVPIVDRILRAKAANPADTRRIKAIIVYPMNALANSQMLELEKFLQFGYPLGGEPVTFARYTGQERPDDRAAILAHPPDIVLTNYVMLDLVLTRPDERQHLIRAAEGLDFLVLDELHTYRGRQGSDVAMLARRVRNACRSPQLQIVGTSATMASGGSAAERAVVVADVASRLFGSDVRPDRVIGETLVRATTEASASTEELSASIRRDPPSTADDFLKDALAAWVESTFGVAAAPETGGLVRQRPTTVAEAGVRLSAQTGIEEQMCIGAIQRALLVGSRLVAAHRPRSSPFVCTSSCPRATPSTPAWNPRRIDTSRTGTSSASPGAPSRFSCPSASAASAARSTTSSPSRQSPAARHSCPGTTPTRAVARSTRPSRRSLACSIVCARRRSISARVSGRPSSR